MELQVTCVTVDKGRIVIGNHKGEIVLWDKGFVCVCSGGECKGLAFVKGVGGCLVSSGDWVVSLHSDGVLRAWDMHDGRCVSMTQRTSDTAWDRVSSLFHRVLVLSGEAKRTVLIDSWVMEQVGVIEMEGDVRVMKGLIYVFGANGRVGV